MSRLHLPLLLLAALLGVQATAQTVTVSKFVSPTGDVEPGGTLNYTIQLQNPFNSDLGIGYFQDFIPANTAYIPGTLTLDPFVPDVLWHFQGEVFNTGLLLLPANGATTIEFSVMVDGGTAPGTSIVNFASTDYGDSNATFNTVTSSAQLFSFLDVDPPGVIGAGELLTYTLTIFNFGFGDASGVEVIAPIPGMTAFESGSIQLNGASGSVAFESGNNRVASTGGGLGIPAQGGATLVYQVRVNNPLPDDTPIIGGAFVNGVPTNSPVNFTVTLSDYIDLDDIPGNVLVNDVDVSDATGFALGGGDFDNDGKGDLIIGDPTAFIDGSRRGVVHIVYGGFLLTPTVTLPDTGAATTQILPPNGTDLFGIAVAVADMTGDGVDDILIGAPGLDASLGPGEAFLIQGGAYQNVIDLQNGDDPRTRFHGAGSDLLGRVVAAGDFNGDGVADPILGAPGHASGPGQRGRVLVVPGGGSLPGDVNFSSLPAGVSQILGDPADGLIANTPRNLEAGDVNGDGRDDIIIGASSADTPVAVDTGKVFVVHGSGGAVTIDLTDTPAGWTEIQSEFGGGQMGFSVGAGDLNGDGFDDIAMGAPQASWILTPGNVLFDRAGVVFTLLGRSDFSSGVIDLGAQPPGFHTVFGEFNVDNLGMDVVFGDYTGDGFDELIMGAPDGPNVDFETVGVAHVLVGTPRLRRQYLLPFAPTGTLRFYADNGSEAAFQSLGVGDLNSDGFADLFLGDYVLDPGGSGATDGDETHVFFGKPRGPRLELASAGEIGVANRSLETNEQIILQFDQDVVISPGPVQAGDLFLTNAGATLGAQTTLIPNPNDSSQAILHLGSGFQNLIVDGVLPQTSTNLDIGASIREGLITSAVNGLPAEDTGLINVNDRGVDIVWNFETVPMSVTTGGGTVTVTQNADRNRPEFAYTSHSLQVPSGALGQTTQLAIARPPASLSNLNLRTAVQITDDMPGVPTFSQPATLTLEYREEDIALADGSVESLFRIYQIIDSSTASLHGLLPGPGTRILPGGQMVREVSGTQIIDTATNTVRVEIDNLDPEGAAGAPGVFATLPVNPVEERQINIKPQSAAAAIAEGPASTRVIFGPNPTSPYSLHAIDFPGYTVASQGEPGSVRVTIRTANLFERTFATAPTANRFPTQSGAVFTVETRDAGGNPIAFSSPAHVTVQYISRPAATDTDVVDFSSVVGDTARMRVVHSAFSTSSGTNFQFVDRPQGVDLMSGKVTVEGFAGLTGPSGVGVIGAVIDTRVEIVGLQQMIDAILGKTTLTLAQTVGADVNGDGDLDMADVVAIINAQ